MKRLLRALILLFVRLYGAPAARKAIHHAPSDVEKAPRILLVRPDHLGDLILTTPVLQALKERLPDSHITMMVGPWSAEVVRRHPAIDELIVCPFPGFQRAPQGPLDPYKLLFREAAHLRNNNYDLALNLRPDFWWGAALLYLATIPQRIGYAIEPNNAFLTISLPFHEPEHATVSNLRLASTALQALHHSPLPEPYTPARYPLYFKPNDDERQWVIERLSQASIQPADTVVVIHAGTGGAVKLWRNEGWTHIANKLIEGLLLAPAVHIVLTGSPGERPMLEEIARGIPQSPLLITDATVGQLAALLERAQLVLGVDSGPLHVATAEATQSLRIFGPTDSRIFGPWGNPDQHVVLAATQACPGCPFIPCGRLDFSPEELAAHPCVKRITDQQVEQAINQLVHSHAHQ